MTDVTTTDTVDYDDEITDYSPDGVAARADAARNRGQEVSDMMLTMSTYTSIAIMTLFQLLIMVLLAFSLRAVARGQKWADAARRLLTVFSIFFVIRTLLVVIAPAAVAGAKPAWRVASNRWSIPAPRSPLPSAGASSG